MNNAIIITISNEAINIIAIVVVIIFAVKYGVKAIKYILK